MQLEQLCTSQHWSKELKKRGFVQDTYFSWFEYNPIGTSHTTTIIDLSNNKTEIYNRAFGTPKQYFAPTTDELLAVMPMVIKTEDGEAWLTIQGLDTNRMYVDYSLSDEDSVKYIPVDTTLPNALAEMVCWLVDNRYLKF